MINPLTVGAGVAAVLAGPALYSLVQTGELDGTSALARGLVVAAVCAVGTSFIQGLISDYDREAARREAIEQARIAQAARIAEAQAQALAAQEQGQSSTLRNRP